jgi:pimeloyl-ACP methyl ester carboxylesterase
MSSDAITPFRIAIPDAYLADLKQRLAATRWPDSLPDPEWRDGVDRGDLQQLCARWEQQFDWRAHEASLNEIPQFTTTIDGQRIHFCHGRSSRADARALILGHGWPSSMVEYRHVLRELAEPKDPGAPAFHVVLPSLVGYGFSEPARARGWGLTRMADGFAVLMARLGYESFGAHGGDAGYFLVSELARRHAARMFGVHISFGGLFFPARHRNDPDLTEAERRAVQRLDLYVADKGGYANLQSTRPMSHAYALTDSPAGQLAWIAEKWREWSDPSRPIDVEDLLTNVSIYWFTRTAGSSARLYKESTPAQGTKLAYVAVPTGIAAWPHEIVTPSRRWVENDYNVVHWGEREAGGHFAALEAPELLVENLRAFFAKV